MTTRIKICGITNLEDAHLATQLGADALGFVFSPSPRHISPEKAHDIISQLPPFIHTVGVFANEPLRKIVETLDSCAIDVVQLHGDESQKYCQELKEFNKKIIKAIRVRDELSLLELLSFDVDAYLFDSYSKEAYGGTGKTFDWGLLKGKKFAKPVILSGGLEAGNVREAIQAFQPYAVDASSRLEKEPGFKDPNKVKAFIKAVRDLEN
jgi:phosphoribosylanthranilate isomerase